MIRTWTQTLVTERLLPAARRLDMVRGLEGVRDSDRCVTTIDDLATRVERFSEWVKKHERKLDEALGSANGKLPDAEEARASLAVPFGGVDALEMRELSRLVESADSLLGYFRHYEDVLRSAAQGTSFETPADLPLVLRIERSFRWLDGAPEEEEGLVEEPQDPADIQASVGVVGSATTMAVSAFEDDSS